MDGSDGLTGSWVISGKSFSTRLKRQQGGEGMMFWTAIVGDMLSGPYRVHDGVKLDSQSYVKFLSDNVFSWYRLQSWSFRSKCIFMHDNAPVHASKFTKEFLGSRNLKKWSCNAMAAEFTLPQLHRVLMEHCQRWHMSSWKTVHI